MNIYESCKLSGNEKEAYIRCTFDILNVMDLPVRVV